MTLSEKSEPEEIEAAQEYVDEIDIIDVWLKINLFISLQFDASPKKRDTLAVDVGGGVHEITSLLQVVLTVEHRHSYVLRRKSSL